MTITNNVIAKASVAFVALAMAISLVAPKAQAADVSTMSLDELIALVNQLQAQVGQTPAASGGACVSIAAPLTIGSQGADVTALQNFLIGAGMSIPAGATGYFGAQTQSALAAWQAANGVSPAVGYYGPITKAAVDAKCVPSDDGDDTDDTDDGDDSDVDLSGEASLGDVESSDGDDTDVEEGQEAAPVAEFEVEFEDGDAVISRIDLSFNATSNGGDEEDAWDTFEEISLWVDGDEVASMTADDEDEWMDDEPVDGTDSLRFSGLDIVAMEDEPVTIVVGVTVQGSVDDVPATWDVDMTEIRYVDADDVTSTDEVTVDAVDFDIEVEGADDELAIKTSTEDPDSTTLQVEDDGNSDLMTIFAFDMDSDDSTNDLEVNTIRVGLQSGTADVADIINDLVLVIDGEEYDDWSFVDGTGTDTTVDFEIDGDLVIDAGSRVTAELQAEFTAADGVNYNAGDTISASTTATGWDVEGADDVDPTGSATGETHTLRATGIVVEAGDMETETQGENDTTGIFTIEFDVTAFEEDFYINDYASKNGSTTLGGVEFSVDGPGSATSSGVLASTADDDTGAFVVREGETETFTLTVTVDASATGQHRVNLTEIWFATATNGTSAVLHTPEPAADYRTDYENINAS